MTPVIPSKSLQPGTTGHRCAFKKNTLSANWMTALSAMLDADYLRRQADTCLRIARSTFDLATAERLRFLAVELRAKAAELDDQTTLEPHVRAVVSSSSRAGSK